MVTYISTKNREKYLKLFSKAYNVFDVAAQENRLPEGIDMETLEIATLNQYFAYLQDLIATASNENIKSYLLRLPLDEDFFEINANTRAIKVPTSFARNGIGVQGDETAEIVYFTIDRYFDHTDLASEDMNIVIQWEAKDKNKKTIVGISPNFGKDIETIPGKIIFGWPIYSELTQAAGSIKFAVRFYSLGEPDPETGLKALNYSLATLPAEVSVGATLNYNLLNSSIKEIDRGDKIINRIKNTGIYDPSIPTPGNPVMSTPLYVLGTTSKIVDLPADGDGAVELRVSARPSDFGAIQYTWKKYAYDPVTGDYPDATTLTSGITTDYEEMTETLGSDTYYRIVSGANEVVRYEPVVIADELASTEYTEGLGYATVNDGGYYRLYKKYSIASVDKPGIYTVDIGARYGTNTKTVTMDKANGVKIPGPVKPVVDIPSGASVSEDSDGIKMVHIIVENDGLATLTANAHPGEDNLPAEKVGETYNVDLAYDWKKNTGGNKQSISDIADLSETIVYTGNTTNEMTISGLDTENLDSIYYVDVTATRNSIATTQASANYRLTEAPKKPVLKRRVFNATKGRFEQVASDYKIEDSAVPITKMNRNNQYSTINFSVEPIAHSDNISYVWMKANIDDNEPNDWLDEERTIPKLQVDLDDLLPDLFANLAGDPDIAADGAFGLTTLSELGEVVDDAENGPSFTVKADTEGYLYCIVINELNNHRVANVSPFYRIVNN